MSRSNGLFRRAFSKVDFIVEWATQPKTKTIRASNENGSVTARSTSGRLLKISATARLWRNRGRMLCHLMPLPPMRPITAPQPRLNEYRRTSVNFDTSSRISAASRAFIFARDAASLWLASQNELKKHPTRHIRVRDRTHKKIRLKAERGTGIGRSSKFSATGVRSHFRYFYWGSVHCL